MASEPSNAAGRLLGTNSLQNAVDEMARSAASIADSVKSIQQGMGMNSMGFGKSMIGKDLGTIKAQSANGGNVQFSGGTGGGANQQTFQQRWNNAGPMGKGGLAAGALGQGMQSLGQALRGGDKTQNFIGLNDVMTQYNPFVIGTNFQQKTWGNKFWQGNAQNGGDFNAGVGNISGMGLGGSGRNFNTLMSNAAGVASAVPGMSLATASAATAAFNSNISTNMLAAAGIRTTGKNGMPVSPVQIAKQILDATWPGWEKVRTFDAVAINAIVYNPGSKFAVSLSNLVQSGAIGSDQQQAIQGEATKLLAASAKFGVTANQIDKAQQSNNQGLLRHWGIGNSDSQKVNQEQGAGRAAQSSEIDAFNSGLDASTKALTKFHDVIGSILKVTGLGSVVGGASGASGVISTIGHLASDVGGMIGTAVSVTKTIGGILGLGGNSESRMSVGGGAGGGAATGGNSESRQSVSGGGSSGGLSFGFPTSDRKISTPYGVRGAMWHWKGYHTGVDFSVPQGTPVMASATGTVVGVGPSAAGASYGQAVLMDHGNGWQTLYAHNSRVKTNVGAKVSKGTVIAYSGATGNVTGPHVHFEIRRGGNPVNPTPYLRGATVAGGSADANGSASSGSTGTGTNSSSGSGTQFNNAVGLGLGMSEAQILGAASGGAGAKSTGAAGHGMASASTGSSLNAGTPPAATGNAGANQSIAKQLIRANPAYKGWDSGAQWNDLVALWNRESGWNANAVNPSSGAYGIAQILPSAHPGVNLQKNARGQIEWGLNYIAGRYGNPAKAWGHETIEGWYDKGAWELSKDQTAKVHKGEMIIPKGPAEDIRRALTELSTNSAVNHKKGGGAGIVFQAGAIQLVVGQGATVTQAQSIGRAFTESFLQDERIKAIQEGF